MGIVLSLQWKKEMASHDEPPGYDPPSVVKSKTKSAKRNERKKEKRLQVCLPTPLGMDSDDCLNIVRIYLRRFSVSSFLVFFPG